MTHPALRDLPGPADLPEQDDARLDFLGKPVSPAQLRRRRDPLAAALWQAGLRPAETLALLLPDSPGLIVASFAALRLGARPQLLDPAAAPGDLVGAIASSGARLLLTFDLQVLLDRSLALPPRLPDLRIALLRFAEELPFPHNLLVPLMRGSGLGQRPAHPAFFRLTSRSGRRAGSLPPSPRGEARLLFSDGEATLAALLAAPGQAPLAAERPQDAPPLHRRAGFAELLRRLALGERYRIGALPAAATSSSA